jgi:hypothetical protein
MRGRTIKEKNTKRRKMTRKSRKRIKKGKMGEER